MTSSSLSDSTPAAFEKPKTWEPMRFPLFRMFWAASLASNLGTWIHEIGASWLMTDLSDSPLLVSAVRTSMSLPILLLALPAGVLADRIDRRRLLIGTQFLMLVVAASMAFLTWTNQVHPAGLLGLTTLMGLGMVLHVPTWQACTPELVPRRLLPQAVSLGSISFNLARSVGPAIGGFLIGVWGPWSAFAMNAVSFAGVLFVLLTWKRETTEQHFGKSFSQSMMEGLRFALHERIMRNVLLRVFLFVLPASALWSQLPLLARFQLQWDSRGYGLMVCGLGVGAVLAAFSIDRLRYRFGSDRLLAGAMLLFSVFLALLAACTEQLPALLLMLPMGACWMIVLTTLNATAQMTLPQPLRARGMACYLTSLALAMSAGSMIWGQVAELGSPAVSLVVAAGLMAILVLPTRQASIGTALTETEESNG
ncbi:enterobactin exporter EntS [Roseimaritima multifibrata]|uniref:Enterobactin exporter EntS n=1 Tax=Roseimaritima multifibrata TaxID=1930274 RepID=A0A517MDJ2_9BACT|nr:MFS transporter [Roseimaritima multifibrata]QDS92960.1 enterobactin exporter EntS [Roseimaritima multifibrata]